MAILLTLAALVLVTAASAALARIATTARVSRELDRESRMAADLLREARRPIEAWLSREGRAVVLPPDATVPNVAVLDDAWIAAGREHALTITAFDQCGMVPVELARGASPLRALLSTTTLDLLRATRPRGRHEGLDVLQAETHRSVFPEASASDRPGAQLATHGGSRVNVSTAPMRLVAEALRLAIRGGIESIETAREEGRIPPVPAAAPGRLPARNAPEIVASSSAWSFRIDVRVGAVSRSWWEVHEQRGGGDFQLVQRLAIPY